MQQVEFLYEHPQEENCRLRYPTNVAPVDHPKACLGARRCGSGEAAEAAAVRTFNLSDGQRSRLVVQERG